MDYTIRRSPRARRVRVSVHGSGEIEVVLPRRAPERAAAQAVRELEGWIERRRRTLARAAAEVARPDGTVPFLGRDLRLVPQPGRERIHRRGDDLLVPTLKQGSDPYLRVLERWYRRQAKAEIGARLDAATARAGSTYTGLPIRGAWEWFRDGAWQHDFELDYRRSVAP